MEKDLAIKQKLRSTGLKATIPRLAVLKYLSTIKKPQSIEMIRTATAKAGFDQATLYRIMESLLRAGLARRVEFGLGHALYELEDSADHHHLVCINCGRIEDIDCDVETLATAALKSSKNFQSLTGHTLELYGLCKACSKKA